MSRMGKLGTTPSFFSTETGLMNIFPGPVLNTDPLDQPPVSWLKCYDWLLVKMGSHELFSQTGLEL
jgi:hypothetical protein